MPYNPQAHHRCSIRLKGYDYTQPGAYFVTLVTQGRECLFGEIENGEMRLSPVGQVVRSEWLRLDKRFPKVELDEFMVMPNHVHGIIVLVDRGRGTGDSSRGMGDSGNEHVPANFPHALTMVNHPRAPTRAPKVERFGAPVPGSIPTILRSYKSSVTQRVQWIRGRGTGDSGGDLAPEYPPCAPTVWQRNYYEHIIRGEAEWDRIRAYILDNPRRWAEDRENLSHR